MFNQVAIGKIGYWVLGIGHWALGIGHWALDIGHWVSIVPMLPCIDVNLSQNPFQTSFPASGWK
ncbi:MAG: hypothetical protein V7K27_18035 [Nostoc sp.]|uniref:hypothetical protein n=1 Tax=Nostoc sp. TaxID=1180 RepID=UPI002FF9FDB1